MKTAIFSLFLAAVSLSSNAQVANASKVPLNIGDQLTFHSDILDQDRILNVYLPESYHPDSTQRYPIIYLLDGSMHEDFLHISGLVQFGSYSWINMLPESIVVGISNIDRKHDFTYPSTIKSHREAYPTTGGSAAFIDCIAKEIQPLIESNYRCSEVRVIVGQSLGGLLATEILYKQPDLFTHYMIISPSLWWDDESLLKLELPAEAKTKHIFIAVGKEGSVMVRVANELFAKVKAISPVGLGYRYMPDHDHGDILHQAAYHGFTSLFENQAP